jgi:hypothetical protein
MTKGFIDSGTLFEMVPLFRRSSPSEVYPWSWHSAIAVTSMFMGARSFGLAPSPSDRHAVAGPWGHLIERLDGWIGTPLLPPEVHHASLIDAKRFASRYPERFAAALKVLDKDKSYSPWLDEEMQFGWHEYWRRSGGMFNRELIPQLSRILQASGFIDATAENLSELHSRNRAPEVIRQYSTGTGNRNDYRLTVSAYVASALIRARYHDSVARLLGRQVLHHALREPLFTWTNRAEIYGASNAETYLAAIVVTSAFATRKLEDRIDWWVSNLQKVSQKVRLPEQTTEAAAIDVAISAAKGFGLETRPRLITSAVDGTLATIAAGAAVFMFRSWEASITAAHLAHEAAKHAGVGRRVRQWMGGFRGHLRKLASAGPGRIRSKHRAG